MSVEIKLLPCMAPDHSIVSVAGINVGTVQKVGEDSFIPHGCKHPRSLASAALKLCTRQYDRSWRETEKFGRLVEELLK